MSKEAIALLINDIHVDKDNLSEFNKNWDEALEICKRYNIVDLVIGGDLWQSRSAQTLSTLLAVSKALTKAANDYELDVTIASGNHDKVNQEDIHSYNHIFAPYRYIHIVNEYTTLEFDDMDLYVMSYFPENGSFTERLNKIVSTLDNNKFNILYCHEGIRGGLSIPSEDELPANIFSKFDKVLVGHYHNRNKIKNTGIEYIGSSRQHNFGEDEEKGYTIVYDDGSHEFIKNEVNVRYKVIDIDIANMDERFMEKLQRIKSDGRYKVKVRISCNSKQTSSIDKSKLTECGASKIELVTEQTEIILSEGQELNKKFDKTGIKEEYRDFCTAKNIDNIELGLSYLDKIN